MEEFVRDAICLIKCPVDQTGKISRGTGFLVAKGLVVTALHVVAKGRRNPGEFFPGPISLRFRHLRTEAEVVAGSESWESDCVLLRCMDPPPCHPIPLEDLETSGVPWETWGFPDAQPVDGMLVVGNVRDVGAQLEGMPAFQLFSEEAAAGDGAPVAGLSGAPVLVGAAAVGLLRFALMREGRTVAGTVYACPARAIVRASGGRLKLRPADDGYRPQAALLRELRLHFVGRRETIAHIGTWADNLQATSHLVIEAPAGYGKSALMAKLVELHPEWVYHFVRAEDQHHTATAMLKSLCRQLSRRVGNSSSFANLGLSDLEEEFYRLRARALERSAKLVFAIDGLDETAQYGIENIVRPQFYRADQAGIRYLLTFRTGTLSPAVDLGLSQFESVRLQGLGTGDVADLFSLMDRPDLLEREALLSDLITKTGGEPFYLRFLVEDLSKVEGPVEIPADLPKDSKDYIARQVKELSGRKLLALIPEELKPQLESAAQLARSILGVLVTALDWISRDQLLAILRSGPILVNALVPALRRYFVTERPEDPARELQERYLVTPLKLRESIRAGFLPEELHQAEDALLKYCRDWTNNQALYAYNYLTYHLASTGAYDELIRLIDRTFLDAKTKKLQGAHAVVTDIDRALRVSLDRHDPPKVVRMLLLLAKTRASLEHRAASGGIAQLAAAGLYEVALSHARAMTDAEARFRQLLLVAEAALRSGDRSQGLAALDEALQLEIEASAFPLKDAGEVLEMLLVRYREPDRALTLASKIGIHNVEVDEYLERACLKLIGSDSSYSIGLADRIREDSIWHRTHLAGIRAIEREKPDCARSLLERAIERSRQKQVYSHILEAAAALRSFDPAAALNQVEEVITVAETRLAQEPTDRGGGSVLNQATVELAYHDLRRALDAALARCPEIVDSTYTLTVTLTHILMLAAQTGAPVDLELLPKEPPCEVPLSPIVVDQYVAALAVHYAWQAKSATARELFARVKDQNVRAATAVWLCMSQPEFGPQYAAEALNASQPGKPVFELVLAALKQWFSANAEETRQAIAAITASRVKFEAWRAVLEQRPDLQGGLAREMRGAIEEMATTEEEFSCLVMLAGILVPLDGPGAEEVLSQAVSRIEARGDQLYRVEEIRSLVRLAKSVARPDLAVEAVEQAVKATIPYVDHEVRDKTLCELARLVADESVEVGTQLLGRLLSAVRDPFTKGRVVARLASGKEYVDAQLRKMQLPLHELYVALALAAAQKGETTSARSLAQRIRDPATKASMLTAVARAEARDDPQGSKDALVRCIDMLMAGRIDPLSDPESSAVDANDKQAYRAVLALTDIDPHVALAHVKGISPWRKCLALGQIAARITDRPELAEKALHEALDLANKEKESVNQFRAIANLATFTVKSQPGFSQECIRRALAILPKLDPDERVVAHLHALQQRGLWPAEYLSSIWERLQSDLGEVGWTIPERDNVFEAAREIDDGTIGRQLWDEIAKALIQSQSSWRLYLEMAQATLELAKHGAQADAATMLRYLKARLADEGDPESHDLRIQAYCVSTERALGAPQAARSLGELLKAFRQEAREKQHWAWSIPEAVSILAEECKGMPRDRQAFQALLEISLLVDDLEDRASALEALIGAAVEAGDFEKATSVLVRLPLARHQAQVVLYVAKELDSVDRQQVGDNHAAVWQNLIDAAERSVESLLGCATIWAIGYVRSAASAADAARCVEALLAEVEYAKNQ